VHLKVDNVYKVQNKNIWLNSAEFRAAETKVQYCVSIVFKLVESHVLMCCHSRGDIVGCQSSLAVGKMRNGNCEKVLWNVA